MGREARVEDFLTKETIERFADAASEVQKAIQQYGVTIEEAGRAMSNFSMSGGGGGGMNVGGPVFGSPTFGSGSNTTSARWDEDDSAEITRLAEGALQKGVSRHEIMDVIKQAHARAAVHDHDERWVVSHITAELQKLVLAQQNVEYDDSKDVAQVGAETFMDRVEPSHGFSSWGHVLESLGGLGMETTLSMARVVREASVIIPVYELGRGRGRVDKPRDAQHVVLCALAGVPVRMRVERDTVARRIKDLEGEKFKGLKINSVPEHMKQMATPEQYKAERQRVPGANGEWYEANGDRDRANAMAKILGRKRSV